MATIEIRKTKNIQIDFLSLNGWISILALPQALLFSVVFDYQHTSFVATAACHALVGITYLTLGVIVGVQGLCYRLLENFEAEKFIPFKVLTPIVVITLGKLLWGKMTPKLFMQGLIFITGTGIIKFNLSKIKIQECQF